MRINFDIEDADYILYKQHVGKGNVSSSLRNYVKSCLSSIGDEIQLRQRLKDIEPIIKEAESLKKQLKALQMKKEALAKEQEDRLKKSQKLATQELMRRSV